MITPDSHILLLGSCFTTEVGNRLVTSGFHAVVNPTGNLYNPLSVARTIANIEARRRYQLSDLVEVQGLWRSLDHHTRLAAPTPAEALDRINGSMSIAEEAFAAANVVIVTFGTAYVFERNGRVVCNCHKLPAREFVRRRLGVEEIVAAWQPILDRYPEKQFIFTVSPIRHKADGLHGNQLSKATLHLAIDSLHGADYFEAFEILIDDLRDHRFYAADDVHPSPEAVDEIFRRFSNSLISKSN